MKKRIILLFILFLLPINVVAKEAFDIKSYHVDMVVNEKNQIDITEKIEVFFNEERHGIYRNIPLRNEIKREDGTVTKSKSKIKKIKVSDKFETSISNGQKIIRIGDADKYISGLKQYTIKYKYIIGKDKINEYDELYYNIISNGFDTTIENASFKITMPKEFDKEKLGFSTGLFGHAGYDNLTFDVENNIITGKYNGILYPNENITVRCELPEGYFIKENIKYDFLMYMSMILPIIFVLISYSLWKKYGKDEPVIETVEFYPPENLNSAMIGYIYKGKTNKNDVNSLLIYLANKGYLKIIESEKKKKDFTIEKIKEYDGTDENEKIFMNGLFKKGDVVAKKDLEDKFYVTLNKICLKISNTKNKNKIYEPKAVLKSPIVVIMMLITNILMECKLFSNFYEEEIIFMILLTILGNALITLPIANIFDSEKKLSERIVGIFITPIGFVMSGIIVLPALIEEPIFVIVYLIGFVSLFFMSLFVIVMKKRTKYGNEMLGKIRGFKNFLEKAEKSKLEALVEENPKYFYEILPYTYVLGVSSKWIKQFESIAVEQPDWYVGYSNFDLYNFNSFVNSTMQSTQYVEPSTSSSSSGFSGGGFSGGGFGGGGGGSW